MSLDERIMLATIVALGGCGHTYLDQPIADTGSDLGTDTAE